MKLTNPFDFGKFEQVDEESRKRWEDGLEAFSKALKEDMPEYMKKVRKRAAEVARLAQERFFG